MSPKEDALNILVSSILADGGKYIREHGLPAALIKAHDKLLVMRSALLEAEVWAGRCPSLVSEDERDKELADLLAARRRIKDALG